MGSEVIHVPPPADETVLYIWVLIFSICMFIAIIGWFKNIFKIYRGHDEGGNFGRTSLRIIGIFCFPLGAILGWF